MKLLFTSFIVAVILGNALGVTSTSDSDREIQSSHVTLTCKNSTGFTATGLRTLIFLEWESTSIREHCATEWCYIHPEEGFRNLVMLNIENYRRMNVVFSLKTWKNSVLPIEFDEGLITLSPNNTAYRYELRRGFFAEGGRFSITCIDPSKTTTTVLPTDEPSEATSSPSKVSTTHIIVIVVILLVVCSLIVLLIIFLHRKLSKTSKKDHEMKVVENNNTAKSSTNDLASIRLGNGYTDFDMFKKNAPYEGDTLLTPESTAVYIDPENKCSTTAPDHYDNKARESILPGQNEYSYTYTELKPKPKVKKPTLKPKPKQNEVNNKVNNGVKNGVNDTNPTKKVALLPPKTPVKPQSALQSGTDVAGYKRQPSEMYYEDVEAPETTGSKTMQNVA